MELQSSILEIAEQVKKRVVSPVELTRDCLKRIEKLNSTLNAFITITADSAMSQARQAEEEIQHGRWRGPLHGIPLALKDIIDTAGVRTTAASALFKDRIPREDAAVILQTIAGFDTGDINSEDVPVADYVAGLGSHPKTPRIGVPRAYFFESLDPEIESAAKRALSVLTKLGANVREIEVEAPTD